MDDILETEICQRLLVNEYIFCDNGMKQNDTNTQLKDKFKSATAERNHYGANIISQDSHKSDFLALPWSQFLIDDKEETPDKYSEDAKIEELQVGKAPRQQKDQTPLKGGSWDTAGMPLWWYQRKYSWKILTMRSDTSTSRRVWNVREDSKEEGSNKNPKAFVVKSEGKSLFNLLGE